MTYIIKHIEGYRYEVKPLNSNYRDKAMIFKAFCEENRLMILELLQGGDMCACKLLENLNIGQSTLSHHMKILCDSGIVESYSVGKWTHYSISEKGSQYAKESLDEILSIKLPVGN